MGEFFLGWRRKLGVVTLVIACVVLSAWIRSTSTVAILGYDGDFTSVCICASRRGITWTSYTRPQQFLSEATGWTWEYVQGSEHEWYEPMFLEIEAYSWVFAGYIFFWKQTTETACGGAIVNVPYWSIVIPLTAISAWLLLSKTRKLIPKPLESSASIGD